MGMLGGKRSLHVLVSVKHPLARAIHAPWWGGPDGEQMVLVEAESDNQYSGEAHDTLKLELACRSKFKNLDPKPYQNPAEDPW